MRYETVCKVAPTVEPITLAEAKLHLRIDDDIDSEDTLIESLISAARDKAEYFCGRYFTEQTVAIVYYDGFPSGSVAYGAVELPFPDVTSIESVKYTDTSGTETTIDGSDYVFNSDTKRLMPVDAWPTDAVDFTVTVTTGAPADMTGAIVAMLMIITDLYELRTESVVGVSIAENPAVIAKLQKYRVGMGF